MVGKICERGSRHHMQKVDECVDVKNDQIIIMNVRNVKT